jgi:hypothetical protein
MSPISAAIVNASTHPIPGTVKSSGTYGWSAPPDRELPSETLAPPSAVGEVRA